MRIITLSIRACIHTHSSTETAVPLSRFPLRQRWQVWNKILDDKRAAQRRSRRRRGWLSALRHGSRCWCAENPLFCNCIRRMQHWIFGIFWWRDLRSCLRGEKSAYDPKNVQSVLTEFISKIKKYYWLIDTWYCCFDFWGSLGGGGSIHPTDKKWVPFDSRECVGMRTWFSSWRWILDIIQGSLYPLFLQHFCSLVKGEYLSWQLDSTCRVTHRKNGRTKMSKCSQSNSKRNKV